MRLSSKERLALRLCVELGRHYGEKPISLAVLTDDGELPQAYLARIAARLRREGILQSVRGAQGGYMLALPPESVSVGDVIRAVEGTLLNVDCSHAAPGCCMDPHCVTKSVFATLALRISDALDNLTIADVLADESSRQAMLRGNQEILAC